MHRTSMPWAWVGGIGLLCLGAMSRLAPGQAPPVATSPSPSSSPTRRVQGAGSCSATACHGGIAASDRSSVLNNEHTTWISKDPHSRAYQTLFDRRSEKIAENLSGGTSPPIPAHLDERCLACHATPRAGAGLARTEWVDQDGVGCESCHGASEKWLGPHTTDWWKRLLPEEKEANYGLRRTQDLASRASACTECHVGRLATPDGTAPRDVNHDLIAAGHPRLTFEFAAYSANMPPHWREKGRNASPDFPAAAWVAGQIATTRAALVLLKDRAAEEKAPWPELSEYECFACHHALADEPWRRNRKAEAPGVLPGMPRWGSWHLPMSRSLAVADRSSGADPTGEWTRFEAAIDRLIGEMNKPIPSRIKVAEAAGSAIAPLDLRLAASSSRTFSAAEVERILAIFHDDETWKAVDGWDHATQRYLAIVPFYQTWKLLAVDRLAGQEKLKRELDGLLERLKFKGDVESPSRGFDPATLRGDR